MISFCPICESVISSAKIICDDCAAELDKECFDTFMARCDKCFFPKVSDVYTCERCRDKKPYRIFPVARFDGPLGYSVMYSLKFRGCRELAKAAALYLERAVCALDPEGKAVLAPVPCSSGRLKKNGWDQMTCICRALGRPFLPLLVNSGGFENEAMTKGDYADYVGERKRLNRVQRLSFAKGRFAFNPDCIDRLEELKKTHIIVVDDIITTGSTMKSALDTLESLGFESLSGASWLCEL